MRVTPFSATSTLPFVLAAALASMQPAHAAKINGRQCAGMVSKQVNPATKDVSYSCRTVDGGIESGKTVTDAASAPIPPAANKGSTQAAATGARVTRIDDEAPKER